MSDDVSPWREFWLASELSEATGPAFAERINDSPPPSGAPGRFAYPSAPVPLAVVNDGLRRVHAARQSTREFRSGRMPAASLGAVFSAFADSPSGRRAWPSAGALYPVAVFAVLLDVEHALAGRVVHYEPESHGLTDVCAAPAWDELREPLGAAGMTGEPQVVVLFALDPAAMEAKYGVRAGRFALVEVGHAAQSLALRLAASGLVGCELGGTYDRAVKRVLGLDGVPVLIALGYACGLGPERRRRRVRPLSAWPTTG